jgi:hypothetical protein
MKCVIIVDYLAIVTVIELRVPSNGNYQEGGRLNVFLSHQIANPEILGLNPQSKIRKFLRYASPQITNPQISFD